MILPSAWWWRPASLWPASHYHRPATEGASWCRPVPPWPAGRRARHAMGGCCEQQWPTIPSRRQSNRPTTIVVPRKDPGSSPLPRSATPCSWGTRYSASQEGGGERLAGASSRRKKRSGGGSCVSPSMRLRPAPRTTASTDIHTVRRVVLDGNGRGLQFGYGSVTRSRSAGRR